MSGFKNRKYDHLADEVFELYEEHGVWREVAREMAKRHEICREVTIKQMGLTFRRMYDRLSHSKLKEEITDPHRIPPGQVTHYWDKTKKISAFIKVRPEDQIHLEERIESIVEKFIKKTKPYKIYKSENERALIGTVTDEHIGMNPNPDGKGLFNYEYNAKIYSKKLEEYFNSLVQQRDIFGTFEVLYLDNLGDRQDGWNGFTTRGGHELEQNMTNEDVFEVCVESKLRLIENCINEGIAKKYVLVDVSNDNHCYTEDTEVLTKDGWKYYYELSRFDKVASLDHESGEVFYHNPLSYIENDFDGIVHCYENKNIRLNVTDEHRMLVKLSKYKKKKEKYEYVLSKDLIGKGQMSYLVSGQINNNENDISDELIRFAAWVLTDGSIIKYKDRNTGFAIYQSKKKTKDRIRLLLDQIGIGYRESDINRNYKKVCGRKLVKKHKVVTEFVLNNAHTKKDELKKLLKLIPSKKKFPKWLFKLSKRQFDIFLNEFIMGDGSVKDDCTTSSTIYGTKNILDQLQHLCVINNTKSNLLKNNRGDYCLSVVFNKCESTFKHSKQFKTKRYKGKTWCLTMPLGNMFVRREGIVSIQGNSGDFGLLVNLTISKIINKVYSDEIVTTRILKKFMEVVKYGNHTFIKTHGKDMKYMRSGLPFNLTDKAIRFINEYINHYGLTGFIHLDKGDLHRIGFEKYKLFDYRNFMSFAPPSNWIGHNFGDGYSGYTLRVVNKWEDEIIETSKFLNYKKLV